MYIVSKFSLAALALSAVVSFAQEDSSDGPPAPPTAAGVPEQREDTKQFNQEIDDAAKVIDREKGKAAPAAKSEPAVPAAPKATAKTKSATAPPAKKGKSAPKAKATKAGKKPAKKIKNKSKKKSSQEGSAE